MTYRFTPAQLQEILESLYKASKEIDKVQALMELKIEYAQIECEMCTDTLEISRGIKAVGRELINYKLIRIDDE